MRTLNDLLTWHEQQRRLAMMARMSSGDALERLAAHEAAIKIIKQAIAAQEAPRDVQDP